MYVFCMCRFCPAGVYEYSEADASGERKLLINAQNCVHCKCVIPHPHNNCFTYSLLIFVCLSVFVYPKVLFHKVSERVHKVDCAGRWWRPGLHYHVIGWASVQYNLI